MKLFELKDKILPEQYSILEKEIDELRPVQEKAIKAGLFEGKNLLVCAPTASGKTMIAEWAFSNALKVRKKSIYIVPLKALAREKYKEFSRYPYRVAISVGMEEETNEISNLLNKDIIICTAEKLDSLIRHNIEWLRNVGVIVFDEIHLLNDETRGPTLEILITLLRTLVNAQIIALSATIGNPEELAEWLDAELVKDNTRPVPLKQGFYSDQKLIFVE